MSTRWTRWAVAAAAFLTLLLLIAWIAGFFTAKIDPTLVEREAVVVDPSRLYTIELENRMLMDAIPATITARDETIVSSRILARVEAVNVRAGDVVQRGDILVELEEADLQSQVDQAQSRIDAVSAQLEDARLRLERTGELRQRGLAAQADLDVARSSFDSLEAQLESAREALAEARIVLGYSQIQAPIAGRVVERLTEPGDTVAPGAPLVSLYDPGSIRAEASVRERLTLQLEIGQDIRVDVPSLGRDMPAVIEEIVPAADAASRSFVVKAAIEQIPVLMPGMFARFLIPFESKSLVLVPVDAITPVGQLDLVDVYDGQKVESRFIRLGRQLDDKVVVTSGLEPGERIVLPAIGT